MFTCAIKGWVGGEFRWSFWSYMRAFKGLNMPWFKMSTKAPHGYLSAVVFAASVMVRIKFTCVQWNGWR